MVARLVEASQSWTNADTAVASIRKTIEQLPSAAALDHTAVGATADGDLVQIEVSQVVVEQQLGMSILDLLARSDVIEVDHRTIEAN